MKGLDAILYACYGNHSGTAAQKEIAEDVLLVLRADHRLARDDLMRYLDQRHAKGFDPDVERDVRRFDRLLGPLRGDNPLDWHVIRSFQQDGTVYYTLSRTAFDTSLKRTTKNIRDFLTGDENKRLKELAAKLPDDTELPE